MILSDWESIRRAGVQAVGGKAWNLSRLARYGLNVPQGQVIVSDAYRRWIDISGLEAELISAAESEEGIRAAALSSVTSKLAEIPTLLDHKMLPDERLAVRSSAPQEDAREASFAGIHTSCLNVNGKPALEHAIRTVWLSLWTPAAVAYRERFAIAHDEAAMAVLIMPLIPADVSGIAFTRDPVSGRDDRMVIHANFGLGESLVSGQTAGDEFVLAEDLLDDGLRLLHINVADKAQRIDAAPEGGTELRDNSSGKAQSLDETRVLMLAEQLRLAALALDYTRPDFDIEWAWDGADFWLLQARPITAANRSTYPEIASQPDIWTRGNTREVVPDPLSPIDWGASRRLVNALLTQGFQMAGFKLQPGVQRAGLFSGRLYLNLALMQWEAFAAVALPPEAMNRLLGGHQPEIRVAPPTLQERFSRGLNMIRYVTKAPLRRKAGRAEVDVCMALAARWNSEPLPQSDSEFAARLRHYSRTSRSARDLHFLQGSASGALSFLVDMIDRSLPGEGHALAAALMMQGPASVTAQQSYDLIDIARQAVADPESLAWLQQRKANGGSDWRELPATNLLRSAFDSFLERYGHRGVYESYTRNPRWREQPDYLLDNLLELAETDLDEQDILRARSAEKARSRILHALPFWKRPFLSGMVKAAKEGSNEREAARSALIAMLEPSRRLLLALGKRWVESGHLDSAEDIFFLLQPEIYAVLEGVMPVSSLSSRIEDRRQQFEAWQAEEPHDVVLAYPDGSVAEPLDEDVTLVKDGDCFLGVPVGAGCVTGVARVLHSPEQGALLKRGEILVVPSTDPSWTPLFLKAGGLVMETGGYLSHGAIVAREFGIPAVVNLPGILKELSDGDHLEVNGGRGSVRRIEV